MVAVDPRMLDAILREQQATRATLERMERAILNIHPDVRVSPAITPQPDRDVFRPAARTSAVTADVTSAIASLDCWATAVDLLPILTVRCAPNHLRKILERLHLRGVLDRRTAAGNARWEYRTRALAK